MDWMSRRHFEVRLHYLDPRISIIVYDDQEHNGIHFGDERLRTHLVKTLSISWHATWCSDVTVLPNRLVLQADFLTDHTHISTLIEFLGYNNYTNSKYSTKMYLRLRIS